MTLRTGGAGIGLVGGAVLIGTLICGRWNRDPNDMPRPASSSWGEGYQKRHIGNWRILKDPTDEERDAIDAFVDRLYSAFESGDYERVRSLCYNRFVIERLIAMELDDMESVDQQQLTRKLKLVAKQGRVEPRYFDGLSWRIDRTNNAAVGVSFPASDDDEWVRLVGQVPWCVIGPIDGDVKLLSYAFGG